MSLHRYYPYLSSAFLMKVEDVATRLGISPRHMMAVMDFETAGTFRAGISNHIGAVGLIQFIPSTLAAFGITPGYAASLSEVEQMDLVERYFRDRIRERGPLRSLEDVYMAVLWPAAIGRDNGYVLFRRGSGAYSVNSYLDASGDGTITKGEATVLVRERLRGGVPFSLVLAGIMALAASSVYAVSADTSSTTIDYPARY